MTAITLEEYVREFDAHVARYIPPSASWTPVEKALIQPLDIFRVPLDEAEGLQLAAIQHSFQRHFTQNPTYRNYCLEHGVTPEDICTPEDLEKIPLISDRFFKEHPAGKDFATWIANLFTGRLPRITISQSNPNFEQVIQAFNHAGLVISYSSGTSGLQTVIPRDRHTFNLSEYAIARAFLAMVFPLWDYRMSGYLLMPNPQKTNVYAGKVCEILFDAVEDVKVAIDRALPAHVVRMSMSGEKGLRADFVRLFSRLSSVNMINRIIRWLEYHQKTDRQIAMIGAPYIVWSVMNRLRKLGKRFDFGDRIGIMTGGDGKSKVTAPAAFPPASRGDVGRLPEPAWIFMAWWKATVGWYCPEDTTHLPYTYYGQWLSMKNTNHSVMASEAVSLFWMQPR
jgi:hypothetical protein